MTSANSSMHICMRWRYPHSTVHVHICMWYAVFPNACRPTLCVYLHTNAYMLCISIDSLCLLDIPRKYQAAQASRFHSLHSEEGLPCVWIARNCSVMENTNAARKKRGHLRPAQLLFPAHKAKKAHHAVHSRSHQASDQQTNSHQPKLLFVFVTSF